MLGFDGEPAPCAVVRVFGAFGGRLAELVTGPAGGFAYRTEAGVGRLEVQNEGVVVTVDVPEPAADAGGEAAPLVVSFEAVPCFTLRGHLVDPGGQPMPDVDLQLRDGFDRTIVTVTTEPKGEFRVRLDRAVESIVVDPLGLAHVREQTVDEDGGVAIDLRLFRDDFFAIDGRVLDEDGRPVAGVLVRGTSAKTPLVQRRTKKDGSFVLWSRRPLDYLMAVESGEPLALRYVRLETDRSVEIDARIHGYTEITGRAVGPGGDAAPYVAVLAADPRGRVVPGLMMLARTDADGRFAARVPSDIPHVLGWQMRPKRVGLAAWQPGVPVEITLR